MNLKEAAEREAFLKAVFERVRGAYEDARAETQRQLDEAKKTSGTTRVAVELPDGTPIATTSCSKPRFAAVITDPTAFLAWVQEAYPGEAVERTVTEVRPAFEKALLAQATAAGVPRVVDRETAVIHDVPGVEIKPTRQAGHSVSLVDGAYDTLVAAWHAGELAHVVLPELAPGGTP